MNTMFSMADRGPCVKNDLLIVERLEHKIAYEWVLKSNTESQSVYFMNNLLKIINKITWSKLPVLLSVFDFRTHLYVILGSIVSPQLIELVHKIIILLQFHLYDCNLRYLSGYISFITECLVCYCITLGIAGFYPERIAMEVKWNRTVNLVGQPGHNIAMDFKG